MDSIEVRPVTAERFGDLDELFGSDEVADRCWCMWFIRSVKEFHDAGRDGNRAAFVRLTEDDPQPLGLLAYKDDRPVGWCAVGPKSRYERAVKTPTLRGWKSDDEDATWFVPCLFIHPEHREQGVSSALVETAVELAAERGAKAVEAFPLAGGRRRSGGSDFMTGVEPLFAKRGFEPVHRPSANRVVMQRKV